MLKGHFLKGFNAIVVIGGLLTAVACYLFGVLVASQNWDAGLACLLGHMSPVSPLSLVVYISPINLLVYRQLPS